MKKFLISSVLLLSFTAFASAFTESRNDESCCCDECRCEECECEENCEECRECHSYYCEDCEEHHKFRHQEECCREYRRHEFGLELVLSHDT